MGRTEAAGTGVLLAVKVSHDRWRAVLRLQRLAVIAISALALLLFLLTALRRLRYPFELDRMESAMMTTVWRVVHGMPIYTKPSLEWTPFLYAPLFFYCAAAMTKLTGVGYAALRLVSLVSTLGSCAVLIAFVRRETRNVMAAVASAGLYLMLYSLVLSWYDIGRVDSLSVFFFLLAIFCTRFTSPLLAALVWTLAFQTKQGFLPIAVLSFLVHWQQPRRLLLGLLSFAVLAFGSIALCNHATHGWYRYYVFGTVAQLGPSLRQGLLFVPFDLLQPLGPALALVGFALVLRPPAWTGRAASFYGILSAIIVGGIWFARAHEGAYVNTLLPVYAWICLLFGIALARLTNAFPPASQGDHAPSALPLHLILPALVWLIAFLQIAMHLYRPGAFGTSAEVAKARWDFIARLRATPGEVWVVNHSYDGLLAGKGMYAEMDAFDAVLGRRDGASIAEVQNALQQHRFTAIILDRAPESYTPAWLFGGAEFQRSYPFRAFAPDAKLPEAGDQPLMLYLSCQLSPPAAAALAVGRTFVQQGLCP